jgi:segregation and condensation protein B
METLAIIAYKQPIVKSEIESIRGVDVGAPLKSLMEKKLIRIVGRKDVPGKPIIYGTTRRFLEVFNLKDLLDLPNLRELKELNRDQEVADQETVEQEIEGLGITEREIVEQKIMNPEVIEEKSSEQEIESLEITEREVVEQGIVNPEVIEEKRKEQEIEEIENKDVPDL